MRWFRFDFRTGSKNVFGQHFPRNDCGSVDMQLQSNIPLKMLTETVIADMHLWGNIFLKRCSLEVTDC